MGRFHRETPAETENPRFLTRSLGPQWLTPRKFAGRAGVTDKKRADENAGPEKVFRRGCLKGLSYMLCDSVLCKCEKEK